MKGRIFLLAYFFILSFTANAQLSSYTFTQNQGVYTAVVGGTTLINGNVDTGASPVTSIGFNFVLDGATYTQFSATSNGWMRLGATAGTTTSSPMSAVWPCLAPFARDGKTGGACVYVLSGSAPNRVLTVEWPNWFYYWGSTGVTNNFTMQVKLYETTNVVEFIYGPNTAGTSYTGQTGIAISATNFSNRTTTTNWAASNAGTANTNTMTISSNVKPISGLTYRWVPPCDGGFQTWFADLDGDGYGNLSNSQLACAQPMNFVSNSLDCNDGNVLINPGVIDICDNSIDDDCSGSDSICVILGCMDSLACNFNSLATFDDGLCTFPIEFFNCDGTCISDLNLDGICDGLNPGCLDEFACNFNPGANWSDNTCVYPLSNFNCDGTCIDIDADNVCDYQEIIGCTDSTAFNFNPLATEDIGSCVIKLNCSYQNTVTEMCFGDTIPLVFSSNRSQVNYFARIIPDDQSICFRDTLSISGFAANALIDNVNDVKNIFVNMEHSFMGDMEISVFCPNGSEVIMHQQGGSGTLLGQPIDIDSDLSAGVGYDYYWAMSDTINTNTWSVNAGGTLQSGSYNPVGSFAEFIGCPLNGDWVIQICDLWASDNGYLFDWNMNFSDSLVGTSNSVNQDIDTIYVSPISTQLYTRAVIVNNQTCTDTIHITVNPNVTNDISATIIEGESYTLGTQTLTTAGTYTEVFTSAAGCDSTVTLALSVEPLLTCNITAATTTLCAGESVNLSISATGGAGSSSQLPANLQQGLVAYYPFNGNANDESGNGHNGTVSGAILTADRFGVNNNCYSFDNNQQISIPGTSGLNVFPLTISLWYNLNSNNTNQSSSIFTKYSPGAWNGFGVICANQILANESTQLQTAPFYLRSNSNRLIGLYGEPSFAQTNMVGNNWYHLVFVADQNGGKLYVNGQLIETHNWTGTPGSSTTPLNWKIGGYYNTWFQGKIDDVMLYNRTLADSEIQQIYTAQSYAWSTGVTTNSITVTPTTNTTYSCTVTQGNSTCTASVDITVNPTVTNAISATIIEGESYTLGTQTLTTAGTYSEMFTSAAGCDSTVTLTLAVEPALTCDITAATTTLCAGESVNLSISATGGAGSSSQLPANLQQGLVAYYPFNGNANDESGNGNNGSFTGKSCNVCTSNVTAPPTLSLNRFGVLSDAYNFGPSLDFISIPNSSGLQLSNSFSINLWLSPSSFDFSGYTEGIVLSKWGNVGAASYEVTVLNSGVFKLNTHNQGQTTSIISSSQLVLGAWNFISIIFTEGSCNLFINGEPDAISNSMLVPMMVDNTIEIGRNFNQFSNYSNEGYLGLLDDITIYNRNLSISEIQQLYTTQSFAWNTGATTNSITVSPTSNTTYSCTVTSGSQTCTASVDITVSPQQTFYADADGDGYGNTQVVVTNCNQPAGYVTDNTDCNDNDASVYVASTETCNGLDDNCDGQVDEGLTLGSVTATSVTTALYPTCSGNALKSANLNNGINSPIIDGNGLDLWYSLTAQYNTLRASLSAAFGDNEIRLYSYNNGCFELMETEHEVYTASTVATGNQVLITDDLLVGQTYYIAVHNISGPMNISAKMCFNHFVGTTCDHYYSNYTGVYNNVCTSFKAQYKGNATNYIFDILSATQNNANLNITPWSYTTTTANSVVPRLGTIFPVNMSNAAKVYTLHIPVIYAIPDAAGNYTSITANATTTCTVTLNAELPIALRASDRCPNTKTTTSSISVDRTICGAQRYEWEFTQQLPSVQSPVTVLGGLNTTVFFLNNVPGMGTGKTYNVRVRPIHANGEVGNWGTAQCLKTGTSGMILQSESDDESGVWANNYSPEQAVALYPNPTSTGHFTLMSNASEEEVKQMVITDITGKVVFQSQVVMNGNSVEVEFGDLATGMYLVMVGEERLRLVVE